MLYSFPPDVAKLVQDQMATGQFGSEDDVIRQALEIFGQFAHSSASYENEFEATVAAVREGVADMEAGRMSPLRTVINESANRPSQE